MTEKKTTGFLGLMILLAIIFNFGQLFAQNDNKESTKYFKVSAFIASDGNTIDESIISSPPLRPLGFESMTAMLPEPNIEMGINTLPNVPAFSWSFGCSATSAAMIAGYYDRTGYANMYTGPTNGGLMPLDNSSWGYWHDGTNSRAQCPLSASRNGLDGRTVNGHVDDYWIAYGNTVADPYFENWAEHTHVDCTADFMKTNQTTTYGNSDGATTFYNYSNGSRLYYAAMVSGSISDRDGGAGFQHFYESRGYIVTEMFNQYILGYNGNTNGYTYAEYCAEIDDGNPVMIHVRGHTMVGIGYDTATNKMYIHDTWDYSTHEMTWGGSYSGMDHYAVTIVKLADNASISVTSPNGGESFPLSTVRNISWDSSVVSDVKITLWQNDIFTGTIVASLPASTGTYSWTVGNYIGGTAAAGGNYKIKIKEKGTVIADTSNTFFTITATPSITVTSPDGNESLGYGRVSNITWDSINLSSSVKITLWQNDVFIGTIAAGLNASSGTYSWTVGNYIGGTAATGGNYKIKIKEKGTAVADLSDSSFSIAVPQLVLTSPDGGENWAIGNNRTITWNSSGLYNNYAKITLWQNDIFVGVIAASVSATSGAYSWAAGEHTGGTASSGGGYKIKIKEKGTAVADISDNTFILQ